MQEILSDEIDDPEFLEFAIDNLEELSSYIINGNLNIRIHRDITGEMWFGVVYSRYFCRVSLKTPTFMAGQIFTR